jgi:hypothetical protein
MKRRISKQPSYLSTVIELLVLIGCVLFLASVPRLCTAGDSFGEPTSAQEISRYLGATLGPFAYSGCVPTVPTASLTLDPFACTAFVTDELLPPHYILILQSAVAVGPLSGGDGIYWLAACQDTYTTIAGWTRQSSAHYLWLLNATEPATPVGCLITARITVAAGVVSAVLDLGKTISRPVPPRAFAALGIAPDGSVVFCPTCLKGSNPCSGGSTGSLAVRLNGVWRCD